MKKTCCGCPQEKELIFCGCGCHSMPACIGCNVRGRMAVAYEAITSGKYKEARKELRALLKFIPKGDA